MAAIVRTGLVSQLVQRLPARLLQALDAWSHRVARRRAQRRMQQWQQRDAAATAQPAVVPGIPYHLKPWRD
jgi:hypothetical protein